MSWNLKTTLGNKTVFVIFFMMCARIAERCSSTMDKTCRSEWQDLPPMASTVSRSHTLRFLSVGYVKDRVYLPPLPVDLPDVRRKIAAVVESTTADQRLGGIQLSARCVPCDEWFSHRTFIMYIMKIQSFPLIPCKVYSCILHVREIKQC